jgi:septum formation protein
LRPPIILASTSRYRAELFARLQLPFHVVAPKTDEARLGGETCRDMALRLAIAKARAGAAVAGGAASAPSASRDVARQDVARIRDGANALVIGSDQVAELNGEALGKPGTRENALTQLRAMRGQTVVFHTAIALFNVATNRLHADVVPTTVAMRRSTDAALEHYLDHEHALDCAGSAKSEGLGAALIQSMTSEDPTALIGLPLLRLIDMLALEGIEVLS